MKNLYIPFSIAGFLYFLFPNQTLAQNRADSNYIKKFDKENVIEIFTGSYSNGINFTNSFRSRPDFRLIANSNAYMGMYINYKWLSAKYSWAIPGTSLDKNAKLKFTDIQFRFNTKSSSFHPFFESYNGLLYQLHWHNRKYQPIKNINFICTGFDYYYYLSKKNFSQSAANQFSELQTKSNGSVFILAEPQYQNIRWNNPSASLIRDTAIYQLLSSRPKWISCIADFGYQYNVILGKGIYSLSPAFALGGGILKETNIGLRSFGTILNYCGWLNLGYNGTPLYGYFNIGTYYAHSNLLFRQMNKKSTDMSLTLGYRFAHFSRKLFSIL